jgi:hypothetical protein
MLQANDRLLACAEAGERMRVRVQIERRLPMPASAILSIKAVGHGGRRGWLRARNFPGSEFVW